MAKEPSKPEGLDGKGDEHSRCHREKRSPFDILRALSWPMGDEAIPLE